VAGTSTGPNTSAPDPLRSDVAALSARLREAENQIATLRADQTLRDSEGSVELDPSNPKGYQRLTVDGVTFLVSLQNATPYIDGYRVTVNFGNVTSAAFNGVHVTAKWGPRRDLLDPKFDWTKWQNSIREKEFDLTDTLRAGSWNPVSFVVAPAPADSFGYLDLTVTTNNVQLHQ
jgi:hypothetical protein